MLTTNHQHQVDKEIGGNIIVLTFCPTCYKLLTGVAAAALLALPLVLSAGCRQGYLARGSGGVEVLLRLRPTART
jgi:hypothetical protein